MDSDSSATHQLVLLLREYVMVVRGKPLHQLPYHGVGWLHGWSCLCQRHAQHSGATDFEEVGEGGGTCDVAHVQ